MNAQTSDLKEQLLKTDTEFHDLAEKHHQLDNRLHELIAKHYLSEPEQLEEVTLKKKKLQLKDRMEEIVRASSPTAARRLILRFSMRRRPAVHRRCACPRGGFGCRGRLDTGRSVRGTRSLLRVLFPRS